VTGLLGALACVDTLGEGARWGAGARVADSGGGETGLEIDVDRPWPRPCRLMWEATQQREDGPKEWDYYVYTATRDGWLRHQGYTRDFENPDKVPKGRWVVIDRFGNPLNEFDEFTIPSFDDEGRLWRRQHFSPASSSENRWVETFSYSDEVYSYSGDSPLTHKIKDTEGPYDYYEQWDLRPVGAAAHVRAGWVVGGRGARLGSPIGYDSRGNMVWLLKEENPHRILLMTSCGSGVTTTRTADSGSCTR
jgi:hypothetical protein